MKNVNFESFGPLSSIWARVGLRPHHGFALSLASLRTKKSLGVGEYLDLLPMIEFCKKVGFDVIQLLPLNDTGVQSSPYSALSSCALHPIYLSLRELPFLEHVKDKDHYFKDLEDLDDDLKVDYLSVYHKKNRFLHHYVNVVRDFILRDPAFLHFYETHSFLKPYALFKTFYEKFHCYDWTLWPASYQTMDDPQIEQAYLEHSFEMQRHIILQFLCFEQLKRVKHVASKNHILLKGDIPILVSYNSADVWFHRDLFDLERSAGAPPDMFNVQGQCWNLPLFSMEALRKTQFKWWKDRLLVASEIYDLYRIDHVVGLFRIYAINKGESSKDGFFVPKDPSMWLAQGREVLKHLISFGSMLPIAEDLGCIPKGVRECLQELGICGTKVLRWERRGDSKVDFIPLEDYPSLSLSTVSTHDSETLQLWWELFPEEALSFAKAMGLKIEPLLTTDLRERILLLCHRTPSIFHINLLGEYLALDPNLVHTDPQQERINIPGTVSSSNWTYRMRPLIEDLLTHQILIKKISKLSF